MPVFQIQHTTKYEYDFPVWESANVIKLFPRTGDGQEVLHHQITISDPDARVETYPDYFGNTTGIFNILGQHRELVIDSVLKIRTNAPQRPSEADNTGDWERIQQERATSLMLLDLSRPEMLKNGVFPAELTSICLTRAVSPFAVAMNSMACIFDQFSYIKGITDVETTLDEVLEHRSGVCQDFAHVLLQMLRLAGIPARYVSGYICPNKNGLRGEGATHAWVDAWLPDAGWIGLDPTNNLLVTDTHVVLAVGKNFADCTPVKGTFKGVASHDMSVYVSVGYEDGHISREHNALQMHKISVSQQQADYAQQQ